MWKGLRKIFVLCAVFAPLSAHALTVENFKEAGGAASFSFGYFEVQNVSSQNGVLTLPLEKGQYKNIKILSKDLYKAMSACFTSCVLTKANDLKKPSYKMGEIRTTGKTVIADIVFDDELAVTFLVSRYAREGKEVVKANRPSDFVFNDKDFEKEVKDYIKNEVYKQN